ncbi:MAG: hypothetical protein K2J15_05095, partial [Muribaculaceae bacterium]|nr:hypothetical protein [Muribaculaceae bacterium]
MRSTIKSLLYDFPQDILAEYLAGEDQRMLGEGEGPQDGRRFYDLIGELMAWREKGFSSTETGLLNDVLRGDWLADAECGMSEDSSYHPYERLFLLLQKCGSELLDLTGKDPKVKFENLLRWRELTLLMGEDNLILPVVARHDVINRVGRDVFLWPNTLDHNEVKLNAILDETLSDTHFHLNAGCDVFEFNWLIAMNHPEVLDKIKEDFMGSGKMRAYDRVNRYKGVNLKLKDWVKLAGILRVMLMEAISEDDADILIGTDFGLLAEGTLPGTGRSQALMDKYRGSALRTSNGYIFDYAIRTTDTSCLSQEDISNVYMVHYGERRLIYTFLKYYFSNHEKWRRAAPVVYLYLLIKNKMRRELIQNNDLRGFENFQIYQNFKDVFFHRKNSARKTGEKEEKRSEGPDLIGEIAYRYSVQS